MTQIAHHPTSDAVDLAESDTDLDASIRRRTRHRLVQVGVVPLIGLVVIAVVGVLTASSRPASHRAAGHIAEAGSAPGRARPAASATAATRSATPPVPTVSYDPTSVGVLVDGAHPLPPGYVPPDLVAPLVRFTFSGQSEKRLMRREAASALVVLFAAASSDGVPLAGVSAYRSEARQRDLYGSYSHRDGADAASQYSAAPGTSEHQTGLALDVSGADGRCQASPCFGSTAAARWLAANAARFGFIVRYPPGKEAITGYQYEPWHIRYVGVALAQAIEASGLTMEEYAAAHPPA
jgi:D-alanyl-D-alanine carboxypeptidase